MASENSQNSDESMASKLTYQPFILAVSLIAMLIKLIVSLSTEGKVVDWLFVVVVIVFIAALGVYVWERSQSKRSKQMVSIKTGDVKKSKVVAVKTDSAPADEDTITIETKNVEDSQIKGIERNSGRNTK